MTARPWCRLYRHESARFRQLPLRARALHAELLKLTDEAGVIHLASGRPPADAVCFALGADRSDRRMVRTVLPMLLEAGFLTHEGDSLRFPKWHDRQRAPLSVDEAMGPTTDANVSQTPTAPAPNTSDAGPEHVPNTSGTGPKQVCNPDRQDKGPESLGSVLRVEKSRSDLDSDPDRERRGTPSPSRSSAETPDLRRLALSGYAKRYEAKRGAAYVLAGRHNSAFVQLAELAQRQAQIDGRDPRQVLTRALDALFASEESFVVEADYPPKLLASQWGRFYAPPAAAHAHRPMTAAEQHEHNRRIMEAM